MKKKILLLFAFIYMISIAIAPEITAKQDEAAQLQQAEGTYADNNDIITYVEFQEQNSGASLAGKDTVVGFELLKKSGGNFSLAENNSVFLKEGEYIDIELTAEAAMHSIEVEYLPVPGKSVPVEITCEINGRLQFREASGIYLSRLWNNETDTFAVDSNNNDIRPRQVELNDWTISMLYGWGYNLKPLLFLMEDGSNTIRIKAVREGVYIRSVKFASPTEPKPYIGYLAEFKGIADAKDTIHIQGEKTSWKNDATLVPVFDRATPLTEPGKGSKISLNAIGGDLWEDVGETLAWRFEVPSDGMYEVRIKARQNYSREIYSVRQLKIDNEIPFKEAENIKFLYDRDWQMKVLSVDDMPCKFYLNKGVHEISLAVDLGALSETVYELDICIDMLNDIYNDFMMILGNTPDLLRDYKLEKQLPSRFEEMEALMDRLSGIMADIKAVSGLAGADTLAIQNMILQLEDFIERPYDIASKFGDFRGNISSLRLLATGLYKRPLDIDYIDIAAPGSPLPHVRTNMFQYIFYSLQLFIGSFFENYDSLGNTSASDKEIYVWSTVGREQAQVLSELIRSEFSSIRNINVKVDLVKPDDILPMIAGGKKPDILLSADQKTPVNFAARNAVVNINEFSDAKEVLSRFRQSALTPVEFNGGIYGIPETELFPLMFFRKDILRDLKIELPQTWEDVIRILPLLQKKNKSILLETDLRSQLNTQFRVDQEKALSTLCMFIFQNGGSLYTENGARCNLDSEKAVEAFSFWSSLYTNYGLPANFDAISRFRTGESPIVITDMSFYNQLKVGAWDINGLWGIAPVPGTLKEDGTIDHSVRSINSYSIIMQSAKDRNSCWEFLKWWSSYDTQLVFAKDIESIIGTEARLMTANKAAFESLPWPKQDLEVIRRQEIWARGLEEVPGGYFLFRHVNNALRKTIIQNEGPRETLLDYTIVINNEINDKRKEFGLPVYKNGG